MSPNLKPKSCFVTTYYTCVKVHINTKVLVKDRKVLKRFAGSDGCRGIPPLDSLITAE